MDPPVKTPELKGPPARGLERGENVGRFVLIGLLGRGGMGEVYAAYDPELDRKVAVKILHARSEDGEARLLREAQAIAKLQHPNVVVVYDVGKFLDTVFIAMEFVDGNTLGYWIHAAPRTWRETLRHYQAAGRGLAAAHELGMVHRDFKPDNVMLTKDGQIRVMDFGLARQVSEGPGKPLTASQISDARAEAMIAAGRGGQDADLQATRLLRPPSGDNISKTTGGMLGVKLTRTGAQVGTPAYMAPEQFTPGRATDARTDQFSFCVALYEALYGERPFEGDTMVALTASVLQGEVRLPPDKTRVPSWVRRVLLRGLSTDPAKRFPSMKALLAAFDDDPAVRRRRWVASFGAVALAVGIAVAANRLGSRGRTVCEGGGDRFAGVWEAGGATSPRKSAIRAAFMKTGKPFAAQTFVATSNLLDDYVRRWMSMHQDACEATQVRGDQSAEVLDLRMACLGDRLGNVRALTDVFITADDGVVLNAVSAAGALSPLDECANVAALRAVVKPPADVGTRKRVAELRDELSLVTALRDSGQCTAAQSKGVPLSAAVRATNYRPLVAEAENTMGLLGNFCGDPLAAVVRLKEAYAAGIAGRDDLVAAEAAANIAVLMVNRLGETKAAHDWVQIAGSTLERVGGDDRVQSVLLSAEGLLQLAERDRDAAVTSLRRAYVVVSKAFGPDHPLSIMALANIGDTLAGAGRLDEALETDRAARIAGERVVGQDHPSVASTINNECEVLNRLARFADARRACERALAIWRAAGTGPAIRSYGLTGLGIALLGEGHGADAIAPLEEAVAARAGEHVASALQGESRFALARALWSRPTDRSRGLALAHQAQTDSSSDPGTVAAIDVWLADRRLKRQFSGAGLQF
jgi:predicted Ser/Thr protein kinase